MKKTTKTLILSLALGYSTTIYSATNILESIQDTNGNKINAHAGGIIYSSGYYYWYGEYRSPKPSDGSHWDSNQKVTLYKSKDMKNWDYQGVILDLSKDPNNWDLERPKIIYNKANDNFVMWFHLEPNRKYTEGFAGTAVSKTINGPFKLISARRPNQNTNPKSNNYPGDNNWFVKQANKKFNEFLPKGQQVRDLTAFVDDDNKAYLIYESEDDYSLQVVQLTEDYENFTKNYSRILIGKQNEAPSITKYKGSYFLITSGLTGYKANPPRIYKAKSIYGPWEYLGSPLYSNGRFVPKTIYNAQPSYIFRNPKNQQVILMMDIWDISNGGFKNLWKSSYAWLPLTFSSKYSRFMIE